MPGFDEARRIILDHVKPLGREVVPLAAAAGRVLAAPVVAPWDMPQWDNSAMDGYAVRADESAAAGDAGLPVAGFLPAGRPAPPLPPGAAIRIMTGAPLPTGADAVLPLEDAHELDGRVVALRRPVQWDNVRRRGGDIRAGETVLPAGALVDPTAVSLLASLSCPVVPVHRRPHVAVLSTGDELLTVGEPVEHGRIYDSNGPALAAAVRRAGAEPVQLPIARDERGPLAELIAEGLRADALVTTAGVSVGDRDLVREVLRDRGVEEVFWKVDIQPGRPTAFGRLGERPVFSLPGNPVAALLTFELFVRPALRRMAGDRDPLGRPLAVRLGHEVMPRSDRVTLMRVRLESTGETIVAHSSGRQATGFLRTLLDADAVAIVPAGNDTLAPGTLVDSYPLRDEPARTT